MKAKGRLLCVVVLAVSLAAVYFALRTRNPGFQAISNVQPRGEDSQVVARRFAPTNAFSRAVPLESNGGPGHQQNRTINEPYRYPVLPGTDEWKRRVWSELPWSLCQIPEDLLTNLTDLALLNTVLRYPMRGDIHAFDSHAAGLAVTINRFNGLPELFLRPGVPELLKDHFLTMTVDQFSVAKISNDNQGFLDLGFVTALILYPKIFERFTDSQRLDICLKGLQLQAEIRDRYGRSASEEPAARVAGIMLSWGVEVRTEKGPVNSSDIPALAVFRGPQADLTQDTQDALYSVGKQVPVMAANGIRDLNSKR